MCGDGQPNRAGSGHADLIGVLLDAELLDGREPIVKRTFVPKAVFGAAEAAVALLNGE
jgi:hypothetical protein